jgi:hypothetical protein
MVPPVPEFNTKLRASRLKAQNQQILYVLQQIYPSAFGIDMDMKIPADIWVAIAQRLEDRSDLSHLSRTSKALRYITAPQLYKSVYPESMSGPQLNSRTFALLSSQKWLASCVRSFVLRHSWSKYDEITVAFVDALPYMTSLERLGITFGSSSLNIPLVQGQILEILRKLNKPLRSLDAPDWLIAPESTVGLPGLLHLSIPHIWSDVSAREHI